MIIIRRVRGKSMEPTLKEGRVVVGWRWYRTIKPGDVIFFKHKGLEKIKRVKKLDGNKVWVEGDSPGASTDSRSFGYINNKNIKAKLVL